MPPDNFWEDELNRMRERRKLYLKIEHKRNTLEALNLPFLFHARLEYKPWPDRLFYPLWAFQHQKAIRKFVEDTGGDPEDESKIIEEAQLLWQEDPKAVEYNLN